MTIAEQLRAEGRTEGKAEGKAEAVILLLENRGIRVDPEIRTQLESMANERLDALLLRSTTVSSIDELLGT